MAALVKAIEQKRFKQAKLLLKLGDNVNQQEQLSGRTPLLAVCFVEDENLACRITKKLLHRGADVCMQDVYGMSPLMEACKLGKEKLVKVLIQSEECDFAATDNTGNTALIYSVDAGNSHITKALTEAMNIYDVRAADKPNDKGETPLIRAMKLKQNACREVLLSDGKASPNARDFDLKLNAKEWEFYLNEKEENENEDKINIEKNKSNFRNVLHREQNRDRRVKSRTSSIINYRQNLTSTARSERHSVSFTFDCNDVKCSEKFVRRTKSAPLVTCDNHKLLSRSGMLNFESSNAEKSILRKSGFPEKKTKVCFENNTIHGETISKQNGSTLATTERSYKHHEKSCAVEGSLSSAVAVTEQRKMACETGSEDNGKRVSSSQSQLPQLFTLMTQQTTHSFRSSVKTKAPEEQSRKWSSREGKGPYRRRTPRRNSTAMQNQYPSSRRWSTAETSLIALGRYSSLYSRSDFKALNPDNLIILEKSASKTRRSSLQSTPEELLTNVKKAQRKSKGATISPNLLKLNPVLSASLPDSSGSGRIKSARPRYTRQNSDPLLAGSTLLSRSSRIVATTPVIEEIEEGGDG